MLSCGWWRASRGGAAGRAASSTSATAATPTPPCRCGTLRRRGRRPCRGALVGHSCACKEPRAAAPGLRSKLFRRRVRESRLLGGLRRCPTVESPCATQDQAAPAPRSRRSPRSACWRRGRCARSWTPACTACAAASPTTHGASFASCRCACAAVAPATAPPQRSAGSSGARASLPRSTAA